MYDGPDYAGFDYPTPVNALASRERFLSTPCIRDTRQENSDV